MDVQAKARSVSTDEDGTRALKRRIALLEEQVGAVLRRVALPTELLAPGAGFDHARFGLRSQHEEDGILLALHAAAGPRTFRYVELGCGRTGGNAGVLAAELGWTGLMVDAGPKAIAHVAQLGPGRTTAVRATVTAATVNTLFADHGFTGDVDQLSVTLEGNEYWVIHALTACTARLLIVSYNAAFGPTAKVTVPEDDTFTPPAGSSVASYYSGASLAALTGLANERGYGLVAVEPSGSNAFFLADGVAPEVPRIDAATAYRPQARNRRVPAPADVIAKLEEEGFPLVRLDAPPPAPPPVAPRAAASPPQSREGRLAFFDAAAATTPLLGVDTPVGTFVTRTADRGVGRVLFSRSERGEMALLRDAVALLADRGASPRPVFIDCGANIGTTTVPALTTMGFSRAIVFEPEPSNFRLLKANLALNDLDTRVIAHRAAVSSEPGSAHLRLHPRNSGAHSIRKDAGTRNEDTTPVTLTTVDAAVAAAALDPSDIGLLWLDVQGHEAAALQGARAVLAAGAPVVLELHPAMLTKAGGLEDLYVLAAEYHAGFADMRRARHETPAIRPIAELRAAVSELGDQSFTDVLLLPG
ncbi:FkbM family methyltransferase [Svornostia abyssi]|uniref:FkbM family methyltransferase n=1 Tax=Svornostia abyssi TaxID=2898438 RepID=A0ABY5PM03_9ACTN|nr:FkbM family methyltransferase [Parviterribacteraceae bacterium J379]